MNEIKPTILIKLNLIKKLNELYYEAGGATLPSAYKSAVIDMIDTVIYHVDDCLAEAALSAADTNVGNKGTGDE